jgi:hypothetical protein
MKRFVPFFASCAALLAAAGAAGAATVLDVGNGPAVISESGEYVVTGTSTANGVLVTNGASADITVRNLSIALTESKVCPMLVESGCTARVTLEGTNTLRGGNAAAGVGVVAGAKFAVTAESTGLLVATGGENASGIGSFGGRLSYRECGDIEIAGGRIVATAGLNGSGIGEFGTAHAGGGSILISGGEVEANSFGSGTPGAGLGGAGRSVGRIEITGGRIRATCFSQKGAGIYCATGGLAIAGGTVTARKRLEFGTWTNDVRVETGTLTITGGSLLAEGFRSVKAAATNDGAGNAVCMVEMPDAVDGGGTAPVALSVRNEATGTEYRYEGAGHGDGRTSLYFWLPAGVHVISDAEETVCGAFETAGDGSVLRRLEGRPSEWAERPRLTDIGIGGGDVPVRLEVSEGLALRYPFAVECVEKMDGEAPDWRADGVSWTVAGDNVLDVKREGEAGSCFYRLDFGE